MITFRTLALFLLTGGIVSSMAGTYDLYNNYSNVAWPSTWTAVSGLTDVKGDVDGGGAKNIPRLDFVGSASTPVAYWASSSSYLYFRVRVAFPTTSAVSKSTWADSFTVMIDRKNWGVTNSPDYGFAWDAKSASDSSHGLEMQTNATKFSDWSTVQFSDLDGNAGQKLPNDINSSGRTTDGYMRAVTLNSTVDFGDTTYIDYAIAWSYLSNYTSLRKDQTWRMALADFQDATDHNQIGTKHGDLVGANSILSGDTTQYWSYEFMVPEPSTNMLLSVAGGFSILSMVMMRRRRK